ncbi:MAG: XdhC family protein, partial [Gammaproteobacteria bacterium]|nr:XdhC family protein [Gammaproteobacteria bacterium]
YDLRDEADEIWGLGIGCNGLLKILLQRLSADTAYEPFHSIARAHRDRLPAATAVVVDSADAQLPLGATLLRTGDETVGWFVPDRLRGDFTQHLTSAQREHGTALVSHEQPGQPFSVLYSPVRAIPRLLILGAGPDAVPLVKMGDSLGWLVSVADHREAYLQNPDLKPVVQTLQLRPGELTETLRIDDFDAVVVMSHHLDTDRSYLSQLARSSVQYVGVLGPRLRRNRLLDELGPAALALGERLRGPIGLDIGADSPESIALSVLAEIQQSLR